MAGIQWSEAEKQLLREVYPEHRIQDILHLFPGRTEPSLTLKAREMGLYRMVPIAKVEQMAKAEKVDPMAAIKDAAEPDKDAVIARLADENARLRAQLTWAQHADAPTRTGGLMTIFDSDWHVGDANHKLESFWSAHYKIGLLIKQYEPDLIQYIQGGDIVAGRGIYKEQDLDMAVSSPEEQCKCGAVAFYRVMRHVREHTDAPVRVLSVRGNHCYTGGVSLAEYIALLIEKMCRLLPDVSTQFAGDRALVNLAYDGVYNALALHGYGHSKVSPSSPTFISDQMQAILRIARSVESSREIPRRVMSGHTHWHHIGMEAIEGLTFDTAGGWQRNTRVKLGMNQRPTGFMVYVSPPGLEDDILAPISVKPDPRVNDQETEDAALAAKNRAYCGELAKEYVALDQQHGWSTPAGAHGLVNFGR